MSWAEFLTLMLESTHKVEKAAIFNSKGQPLATTEDLQITEADGRALLNCLHDPARTLTRILLDGINYHCFQGNATSLVGRSISDAKRVLVARLVDDALVLVLGHSTGHGSFLYEVQYHLDERERRKILDQQKKVGGPGAPAVGNASGGAGEASQKKAQSALPAPVLPPPMSPTKGQGDVLVQLNHD